MSKKPHKIEESAAPYAAKKPVVKATPTPVQQSDIRYADLRKIREANAKLIHVHRAVLQKLAQ